jgi:sulfur-oxidizing protein SoxX
MARSTAVRAALAGALAAAFLPGGSVSAGPLTPYHVTGDAIAAPLGGLVGDADRGRRIVLDRGRGNCLICHAVPVPAEPFQGDLGPDLAAVGSRLTAGQIRLRMVDTTRVNPDSIMPPFYRVDGLVRVATRFAGTPVLTAQEIEDVVSWLETLK